MEPEQGIRQWLTREEAVVEAAFSVGNGEEPNYGGSCGANMKLGYGKDS